jgi:hypothetical protein
MLVGFQDAITHPPHGSLHPPLGHRDPVGERHPEDAEQPIADRGTPGEVPPLGAGDGGKAHIRQVRQGLLGQTQLQPQMAEIRGRRGHDGSP